MQHYPAARGHPQNALRIAMDLRDTVIRQLTSFFREVDQVGSIIAGQPAH